METTVLLVLAAAVIGAGVTYLLVRGQATSHERIGSERVSALRERVAQLENTLAEREDELRVQQKGFAESAAEHAATAARMEAEIAGLQEQVQFIGQAREALSESFKSLASDALKSNNQSFLDLARESLTRHQEAARTDLEHRQRSIAEMIGPVKEVLSKVDTKIDEVEKQRAQAYGGLTNYLETLSRSQAKLESETANLVKALRSPSVRGQWGEIQLRRVVEMAGMVQYCDFLEQPTIEGDGSKLRPDLIIKLPNDRSVVVDAKAPLHHYLKAMESSSEEERHAALQSHALHVRRHLQQLGTKGYWEQLDESPEFVVLFLPGEAFFSAALEQDPELIQYGVEQRVILATPTTLIALLKAIAYGWKQEQLAESAREISALGREMSDRIASFVGHFQDVKKGLDRAVSSYNRAVGSLESRVLVTARRFRELGAGGSNDVPKTDEVLTATRRLHAPDFDSQAAEVEDMAEIPSS